jgi:HEAT repeat protein
MPRSPIVLSLLTTCLAVATSGPARASDDEALPERLVALVTGDDADFRGLALEQVRRGGGGAAATRRLAALLPTLPPARQAELVAALGTRGDAAALAAIGDLFSGSADAGVRLAAIRALGALGGAAEIGPLAPLLAAGGPEADAATQSLVQLRGAAAAKALRAAAAEGAPAARARLYDVLRARRDKGALAAAAGAATSDEPPLRAAALALLRDLGGPADVPAMVQVVLATESGPARQEAERALVAVCQRNPGHEAAARGFLEIFRAAPVADREPLLPILGAVGGTEALGIIDALVASPDAATRRLGIAALSRWPDAAVVSRLLELVARTTDSAERDLVVGGLIRIAPLPDNGLDDAGRLDLVRRTFELCRTADERARLLERASAIRTVDTLRFVKPFLADPALAEPACRCVVELAHHRQLRDGHRDEFLAALDAVVATTKDSELVERAGRYKAGKTWERGR